MRDPGKAATLRSAAEAAGVIVDVRPLDVTDPDSITMCVESVVADLGHLDAVLNNAGAAHVGIIETDDLTAVRACLEVNFFGVVQLTRAVLPHLRTAGGRLVTVTSVGGVIGQPSNEAYCAAKFAVEGFMESLAPVAASTGVRVSVVEPGAAACEFITNAGFDPQARLGEAGPYAGALRAYLTRVTSQFAGSAQPASDVADIIVALLSAEQTPFRVQTSDWARQSLATKLTDIDGSAVQTLTTPWVTGLTPCDGHRRTSQHRSARRPVTMLELYFNLVFVFLIAQPVSLIAAASTTTTSAARIWSRWPRSDA